VVPKKWSNDTGMMIPRRMVIVVLDALRDMGQLARLFPNDSAGLVIS
jgi:hypothetical protein